MNRSINCSHYQHARSLRSPRSLSTPSSKVRHHRIVKKSSSDNEFSELAIYRPGDIVNDKYVCKDVLGVGSSAETLLCEFLDANANNAREEVAVKILTWKSLQRRVSNTTATTSSSSSSSSAWKALDSFERESKVLQSIKFKTVPEYVEHFEIEKGKTGDLEFILVQKVAKGKSLIDLVESGTFRPKEEFVKKMLVQLLETVSYLESLRPPVWHRDITPNNVIVDLETETISLVDFGAVAESAVSGGLEMTRVGTSVGTFGYAAPEQLQGRVGKKSDQYGVGATILFAMSGCPPSAFPSERLKIGFKGRVTIDDRDIERCLDILLEPLPEDRFRNAKEALELLENGAKRREERKNNNNRQQQQQQRYYDDFNDDYDDSNNYYNDPYYGRTTFGAPGFSTTISAELESRRPNRRKKPANTKVQVYRNDDTKELAILIPPAGFTGSSAMSGGFALAWNAFVATWTMGALASGGAFFALFSIPFWLAGGQMTLGFLKNFEAAEISLTDSDFGFVTRTLGKRESMNENGNIDDISGAEVVVESITNGIPNSIISLEIGAKSYKFGSGLKPVELDFVAGEINDFIDKR
jgi:eukaryotic-like serine/threonine-protein kinase